MVAEKRLIPDGCGVKYIPNCGPLDKWQTYTPEDFHAILLYLTKSCSVIELTSSLGKKKKKDETQNPIRQLLPCLLSLPSVLLGQSPSSLSLALTVCLKSPCMFEANPPSHTPLPSEILA